jgi:general secretion pathway protein C
MKTQLQQHPALPLGLAAISGLLILWSLYAHLAGQTGSDSPLSTDFMPLDQPRATGPRINPAQIPAWHLFGDPAVRADRIKAPETRLKLTLQGLMNVDEPERARAIIGESNGKSGTYAIGQEVPGGATIERIQLDGVILKRAGKLESLPMQKELVDIKRKK